MTFAKCTDATPYHNRSGWMLVEPFPAVIGREARYTLDKSRVHHRVTLTQMRETTMHTINVTCTFLDNGRSWSTGGEPTHTRGKHANSTQKNPSQDSNQEPSCCEATVLQYEFFFVCLFVFFPVVLSDIVL